MNRPIATLLLDLAAWIAPPRRRPWIAGMRAEAALTPQPLAWAGGALTTALQQRMTDMIASRFAPRLLLGGFVLLTAAGTTPFFAATLRMAAEPHTDPHLTAELATTFVALIVVALLLVSGGLAVILAHPASIFERYGRWLFGLGGIGMGLMQGIAGYDSFVRGHGPAAALALLAAPLFIAAATGLLLRRPRLFALPAMAAFGVELSQLALEWPRLPVHGLTDYTGAFFGACLPALLLLAATGLLLDRPAPRAA